VKKTTVQNKPTALKGVSAGHDPNHVNKRKFLTKDQYSKRAAGEKLKPLNKRFLEYTEKAKSTITAATNPKTPPSLFGIERKIA
jgi:hypothetical protein